MSQPMRALARAKINLALHVIGRREDSYHDLDTLVTFADVGDVVTARSNPEGPPIGIALEGPYANALMRACPSAGDNLVVRAAAGLRTLAERQGIACGNVHLTLDKQLPVAAGLGGGSSDAAATIAALSRLWSLPSDMADAEQLPTLLGADVAMCLAGRPLRARGIGDRLNPIDLPSLSLVLVNPGVPVSTPAVFGRQEIGRSGALPQDENDPLANIQAARNDLEPAAIALVPEIGTVLEAIASTSGCTLSRMSGSGATCFGIYEDDAAARSAASAIASAHPDWWCVATRTMTLQEQAA